MLPVDFFSSITISTFYSIITFADLIAFYSSQYLVSRMKPCSELLCKLTRQLVSRKVSVAVSRHFSVEATQPSLSVSEAGTLQEIEMSVAKQLNMRSHLPAPLSKQMDTLGEIVTLVGRKIIQR